MQARAGRRKPISTITSVLATLLTMTTVGCALFVDHELHDLRWKLRSGEVLRYRTVSLMGSPDNKIYQSTVSSYTVGNISRDGIADVTVLQEQTIIRKGGPEGPVTWDSSSGVPPPKDLSIAVAAAMSGIPVRYQVDLRGVILTTVGLDEVKKRLRDSVGGAMFLAPLTEMPFSGTGGPFLGSPLASGPIRKGSRWTSEDRFGTQTWGKSLTTRECSLKEVEKGVATITLVSSKTVEESPGDIQKALKYEKAPDPSADGGAEEVVEFSIEEGFLISQHAQSWTQGTVSKGKPFRFEFTGETILIERHAP